MVAQGWAQGRANLGRRTLDREGNKDPLARRMTVAISCLRGDVVDRGVRRRPIVVRLSDEEYAETKNLAKLYDMTISDLVRKLIAAQARKERSRDRDREIPLLDPLGLRAQD